MTKRTSIKVGATIVVLLIVLSVFLVNHVANLKHQSAGTIVDEAIQDSEFKIRTDSIKLKMSENEVMRILGNPEERWEPANTKHFEVALIYPIGTSKDAIMVSFRAGNVISVGRYYGYTRRLDPTVPQRFEGIDRRSLR